jgi:hypothetical protein
MAEGPGPSDVPAPKRRKVAKKGRQGPDEDPKPKDQDKEKSGKALLVFFHMKTTDFDIYECHIVDLAAKVIGEQVSYVTEPTFSSLVHTHRSINPEGLSVCMY